MSKVPRERQRERDVSDYLRLPLLLLLLHVLPHLGDWSDAS